MEKIKYWKTFFSALAKSQSSAALSPDVFIISLPSGLSFQLRVQRNGFLGPGFSGMDTSSMFGLVVVLVAGILFISKPQHIVLNRDTCCDCVCCAWHFQMLWGLLI